MGRLDISRTNVLGGGTLTVVGDTTTMAAASTTGRLPSTVEVMVPGGDIYWAGTETSTYWSGSMDGVGRASEGVAAEVLS